MMTRDPILTSLHLLVQRIVMFLFLSVLMSLVVFSAMLLAYFDLDWGDILPHLRAAWPPALNQLYDILLRCASVIGTLLAVVTYLAAALWWRDAGTVHKRGTRFIDTRREH
jgi:hypothetical protein